jgi:hypothetical protein
LLRIDSNGGVRWFAGKRGEDWVCREGRGSPDGGGIERRRWRFCGVPTSYFFDLGRFEQGGKERAERGARGLYRRGLDGHYYEQLPGEITLAVSRRGRGRGSELGEKTMPTCGVGLSVRGRGGERGWAGFGSLLGWSFSGRPSGWFFSLFFLFYNLFYFLFLFSFISLAI